VVSDRTVYSTLAYQGYGRGLPLQDIRSINEWAVDGHWPELVLLLVAPPEMVERRMLKRQLDRFEQEDAGFHQRVLGGFLEMAANDPDHWVVIDAGLDVDTVGATIRQAVSDRLGL
jgi:dTMP kinase